MVKFSAHLRIFAALGLILFAVIVLMTLVLAITNIFLILALAITTAAILYAGWLVISGISRRRWIGWTLLFVSIALLFVETWHLLTKKNNVALIVALFVALTAYVFIIARLRPKYWKLEREAQPTQPQEYIHPILIINPKSGDGRARKQGVSKKAKALGIEVITLKKGDDMTEIARTAVADGADLLGISGGDGSIGAVAIVAIEYDIPMVVLPGGTRCHFARDLGMDPEQMVDALSSFRGTERRVDVGDINGRIFLNNVSFGLYADILNFPGYRDNKMQASWTVMTELVQKKRQLYDLIFTSNRGEKFDKAAQVLVGVNRYQTMNALELGYRNRMDEGILQVSAITDITNRMVRKLLRPMSLRRAGINHLYQWVTKQFVMMSTSPTLAVGVDGEREIYTAPVHVSVLPGALRIVVPPEGIRPRQRRAMDLVVTKKLWHVASGKE